MWSRLKQLFTVKKHQADKVPEFLALYDRLGGFRPKGPEDNFRKALTHASYPGPNRGNFEKLEFLGDAMLNAVIAELLFHTFPEKDEGELTRMRAWLVSRRHLNHIAQQIGLSDFIFHGIDKNRVKDARHMEGNVLEALLGAYYLDSGMEVVKDIVQKWIFTSDILKQAMEDAKDPISLVYEWAQKKRRKLSFEYPEKNVPHLQVFSVQLLLDQQLIAVGEGRSKKDAERDAAQKAIRLLRIG